MISYISGDANARFSPKKNNNLPECKRDWSPERSWENEWAEYLTLKGYWKKELRVNGNGIERQNKILGEWEKDSDKQMMQEVEMREKDVVRMRKENEATNRVLGSVENKKKPF